MNTIDINDWRNGRGIEVRGHWRTLPNGKRIWIKPHGYRLPPPNAPKLTPKEQR